MLLLNSYAKLNLYLQVLNNRKDTYHNIKTLFERIDLSDKIILKDRQDKIIKLTCNSTDVPCNHTNLAYRSARLLQDKFNLKKGVDIKILKRIPIGAGLGGGSSNAAVVLMGLNKLWELNLTKAKLLSLARTIGSDVPFFIYNCPFAWGLGRGDIIRPFRSFDNLRLCHILIVPRIKVVTAHIYKAWDAHSTLTPLEIPNLCKRKIKFLTALTRQKYDAKMLNLALRKKDLNLLGETLFNDLEAITTRLYPEVIRIKNRLKSLGLKSILMSGSGPAVFGIVSSRKEAVTLKGQLKKENNFWQVFVTETV